MYNKNPSPTRFGDDDDDGFQLFRYILGYGSCSKNEDVCTSCIKQMPRISMHMFAITSICTFFLISSGVRSEPTRFGPLFSCSFSDNDGDHRLALGTLRAVHSEQTRGQLSRAQGPSILAMLSSPLSSFRRTEVVLSPHIVLNNQITRILSKCGGFVCTCFTSSDFALFSLGHPSVPVSRSP
jgi:hypothetical protein